MLDANRFQLITRAVHQAGANPVLSSDPDYYVVDFTLAEPASPDDSPVVAAGELYLGYNEEPLPFIAVDAVQDGGTIELTGHGLQTGDLVTYGVVHGETTRVAINRASLLRLAAKELRFDPQYTADTIELPGHGLTVGQLVNYDPGDDDALGALVAGSYAVIVVDADHIRLALPNSPDTPVDLTPPSSLAGVQEFTVGDNIHEFDPLMQATVDVARDTIWMRRHGLEPGDTVTYLTGGGAAGTVGVSGTVSVADVSVVVGGVVRITADADALTAVVREPIPASFDQYAGFDLALLINLTSVPLAVPKFGVSVGYADATHAPDLQYAGLFHGDDGIHTFAQVPSQVFWNYWGHLNDDTNQWENSYTTQNLGGIPAFGVFVTLVPSNDAIP